VAPPPPRIVRIHALLEAREPNVALIESWVKDYWDKYGPHSSRAFEMIKTEILRRGGELKWEWSDI
jgi:hypothetical protein